MLYPGAFLSFPGRDSLKTFGREVTCKTVFGKIILAGEQRRMRRQCYTSLAIKYDPEIGTGQDRTGQTVRQKTDSCWWLDREESKEESSFWLAK